MRFDLTALAKQARKTRRRFVVIRDIVPPASQAADLYRDCYQPIVAAWEAAIPPIMREYERTLAQTITDSASDVSREIAQAEQRVSSLYIILRPFAERFAVRMGAWYRGKWRAAVLAAASVDIGTIIGAADDRATIGAFVERNVALIKSVSDQARDRISDAVFRGLTERRPAIDVAREIREATGMVRARSIRIASDQHSKIATSLAAERRREAGLSIWEWIHSRKKHPREEHVARNGAYYSDDPADVGKVIDGKPVRSPPEDKPGQRPFCGCRQRSVVVFD